jgi:hypothetical protein
MEPFVIAKGSGFLLSINVWPFPGQPVGVSVLASKQDPSGGFAFPIRVATQTQWLLPEQRSMLMLPAVRNAAILLDQIPKAERDMVQICSSARFGPSMTYPFADFELLDVDPLSNTVTLSMLAPLWASKEPIAEGITGEQQRQSRGVIYVPLDAVETVWKAPPHPKQPTHTRAARWHIAVNGRFLGPEGEVYFVPG